MKFKAILLFFAPCLCVAKVWSQEPQAQNAIAEIDHYVSSTDSNKNFRVGIREGERIPKHRFQKSKGGFESRRYSYNGSVRKIIYHDNFNKNTYITLYYEQDKLVLGAVRLEENGQGDTIYHYEYYFSNDSLLHKTGKVKKHYKNATYLNDKDVLRESYDLKK